MPAIFKVNRPIGITPYPDTTSDPATMTRFSTLYGVFSVTDTRSSRDHEPAKQWQLKHAQRYRQVERLGEDNFEQWILTMEFVLRSLGIWHVVKYPYLAHLKLDEDWTEDWLKDDIWATKIMLMHILPLTLIRYDLPRPLTSSELVQKLSKGPKPFRFLDLPREIRDEIARLVVVEKPYRLTIPSFDPSIRAVNYRNEVFRPKHIRLFHEIDKRCPIDKEPALLHVNRQIRREASEIYWQENRFSFVFYAMEATSPDPLTRLAALAKRMSANTLANLRQIAVIVKWRSLKASHVHVKYEAKGGISADVDALDNKEEGLKKEKKDSDKEDEELQRHQEYCETMNRRRIEGQWKTSGVLGFFTEDPDAFRTMLWGPSNKDGIWESRKC